MNSANNDNILLSVIVCCFNSSEKLEDLLNNLCNQDWSYNDSWELVVVDNASTDNTSDRCRRIWDSLDTGIVLKVVQENEKGLVHARRTGIFSSSGEFALFCDDDNLLSLNYLQQCAETMNCNHEIGILGGSSIHSHKVVVPSWFYGQCNNYAVGEQSTQDGDITNRGYVWGAGMCLQRDVLLRMYMSEIEPVAVGRQGGKLLAGDDSEICRWFVISGYKLWYKKDLAFIHVIPYERLTKKYYKKMMQGIENSRFGVDLYDYMDNYIIRVLYRFGIFRPSVFRFLSFFVGGVYKSKLLHFSNGIDEYGEKVYRNYKILKSIDKSL
jgi:glycosyltransferase involved in cell wall biosynthesis